MHSVKSKLTAVVLTAGIVLGGASAAQAVETVPAPPVTSTPAPAPNPELTPEQRAAAEKAAAEKRAAELAARSAYAQATLARTTNYAREAASQHFFAAQRALTLGEAAGRSQVTAAELAVTKVAESNTAILNSSRKATFIARDRLTAAFATLATAVNAEQTTAAKANIVSAQKAYSLSTAAGYATERAAGVNVAVAKQNVSTVRAAVSAANANAASIVIAARTAYMSYMPTNVK